jgi:hypothetical protein
MRRLSVVFLFFIFNFSCLGDRQAFSIFHSAYAAEEFATTYDITYEVDDQGRAFVVSDIALTNKLSNVYATQYTLEIEKARVSQVGAWDSSGEMKTTLKTEADSVTIHLFFNDQVAGLGKKLKFTLKYEILDFAKKNGEIWELAVPKVGNWENLEKLNLILKVPKTFNSLAFISPKPQNIAENSRFYLFSYHGEIAREGIVAAFGDFQIFDFSLLYHLSNPNPRPVFTKISLPPDTDYQRVFYQNLEPQPENVKVDDDGNWLATYKLSGLAKIEVKAVGQVKISASPAFFPHLSRLTTNNCYLSPQPYWEVNDPEIQKLTQQLKSPREIYDFVVKTLSYDFSRVGQTPQRLGATTSLQRPQEAICTEFTDLFVALCRAAGIPARELNGFAYADNPKIKPLSEKADVLHAWPEYWDEERKVWLEVDPTWEKTSGIDYFNKLDLSHFVFAIHGKESTSPPAAGSYREKGTAGKDVLVTFGQYRREEIPKLTAKFLLPEKIFLERGAGGQIFLENKGPTAIYDLPIELKTEDLTVDIKNGATIAVLPPFGRKTLELQIGPGFLPKEGQTKLTLLAGGAAFDYNITIKSLIFTLVLPILSGVFILTATIIILTRRARGLPL